MNSLPDITAWYYFDDNDNGDDDDADDDDNGDADDDDDDDDDGDNEGNTDACNWNNADANHVKDWMNNSWLQHAARSQKTAAENPTPKAIR